MFSIVTQVHRLNVTAAGHWAIIEHYVSLNGDKNLKFDLTIAQPLSQFSKTYDNTLSVPAAAEPPPPASLFFGELILDQGGAWTLTFAVIGQCPCPSVLLLPPLLLNEAAMDPGEIQPVEAAMNSWSSHSG